MLSEHKLHSVFGLTASEILLTLRLFAGDTLREAAQTLSISYETARTKLKFIFQKTGTRRQTELILLLARYGAPRVKSKGPHKNASKSASKGASKGAAVTSTRGSARARGRASRRSRVRKHPLGAAAE